MKKYMWLSIIGLVLATMVACSNDNKEKTEAPVEDEIILPIEAALIVTEKVEVNETVTMEALITMGEEKLEDASVVYEVWEEGNKEDSEMIDSTNQKEGLYTAETAFDHDGTFHVQVHVDAKGQHTMPKTVVTVGDGGHYETTEGEEGHEHGHSTDGFSMHFMKLETVKINDATELMVHIELAGKPLEKMDVRYEIWNARNEEKHDWVDAVESKPGEYTAVHSFEEEGTYHVQIHVEDDHDLHEHEEHKIEVAK